MNRMKRTSGEWGYTKCKCGACNDYIMNNQTTVGFSLPDAKLIAEAPELLNLLTKALQYLDDSNGDGHFEYTKPNQYKLCKSIKQAIALIK